MTTLGFIGPGIMGATMIANLVSAGHEVRAIGRSIRSASRIEACGASQAESLATLVDGADVVITMLPDSSDVREIALGECGLAELLRPSHAHL